MSRALPVLWAAAVAAGWTAPAGAQDLGRDWSRRLTERALIPPAGATGEPVTTFDALLGERLYRDSNIFQSDTPEDDIVSITYAELDFSRTGAGAAFGAALQSSYVLFTDHDDSSADEHRFNASAVFGSRATQLELRDSFQKQSDPFDPTFASRVERWSNRTDLRARLPLSERIKLEPGVSATVTRAITSGFEDVDNTTYQAVLDASYEMRPRLDFYPGISFEQLDYRDGAIADSTSLGLLLGVRGEILPRLGGSIRLGAQRRSVDATATNAGGDFTTLTGSAGLKYELADTTHAWIQVSRDTFFALNASFQIRNSFLTWVRHDFNDRYWGMVELQATYADTRGSAKRERYQLELQGGCDLSSRFTVIVGATYRIGRSDLDFEEFDATLIQVGATLKL